MEEWRWCSKCDVYFEEERCFVCDRKKYARKRMPPYPSNPHTYVPGKTSSIEDVLAEEYERMPRLLPVTGETA